MGRIAQVLVNIPTSGLRRPFSYSLPPELQFVDCGWRVLVPFGARREEGFVLSTSEGDAQGLKSVEAVLEDEPWFDDDMMATARWISEYYLCAPAEAMRLFIPGKKGVRIRTFYALSEKLVEWQGADLREGEQRVLAVLKQHDRMSGAELAKQLGPGVMRILSDLTRRGWIAKTMDVQKTSKPKYETWLELTCSQEQARAFQQTLSAKPAQQRLLEQLLDAGGSLSPEVLHSLGIGRDVVRRLAATGMIAMVKRQVLRNSYFRRSEDTEGRQEPTNAQRTALEAILPALREPCFQSFLLHGVTASGKTEVYLQAAQAAREQGRGVIILVPEIALTHHIVERFQARFGAAVAVMHSKLSVSERFDVWQKLKSGDAQIAIGARSAVFAPVRNLGLIILDEEHEFTYKQEESPRYHTKTVALFRARQGRAAVIFGSATPSVESYQEALDGKHVLLTMPQRIDARPLPDVQIVDMRQELKEGRRSVLSLALRELLAETLARKEQAIVLLNRRGYSTFVMCRECGHVMKCPHCSVSLVYHAAGNVLRCHYCGYTLRSPDICPVCASHYIRFFGTGTQKVEEEVRTMFPGARTVRMDQDTTAGKMAHEQILTAFARGDYDILLGTQMVAKGLDMQRVTAVGVISADTALNLPDFRAGERTYALLTQAAGRAGRGERPGKVIIQTYNAEHYAVVAGANQDYQSFFDTEIAFRRELRYPPFACLIKITVHADQEDKARRNAETIAAQLRSQLAGYPETSVIGSFPAPISYMKDIFRMHILLKGPDRTILTQAVRELGLHERDAVTVDVDPVQVL